MILTCFVTFRDHNIFKICSKKLNSTPKHLLLYFWKNGRWNNRSPF